MATLQDQSDADFHQGEQTGLGAEMAAEQIAEDYFQPDFADGEGVDDTPAPAPLQYDGKGHSASTDQMDFADDEDNPGAQLDQEEPVADLQSGQPRQRMASDDLHRQPSPSSSVPDSSSAERAQPQEGVSDTLLRRAVQYGMTPGQVRAQFTSDAQLAQFLVQYDQQLLNQPQQPPPQGQPQQQVPQQPMQPQQPQQPPQGQPQQPPRQQQPLTPWELKHADEYEEAYLEDLRGMNDFMRAQADRIGQMEAELQMHRQLAEAQLAQQRQREQAAHIENFEQELAKLDQSWASVLGKGHYSQLDPNSAEMFNRGRVLNTANQLLQRHAGQGRRVDLAAVLESALLTNFPDRQQSSATTQSANTQATPPQQQQQQPAQPAQPRDAKGRYASPTAKPNGRASKKQGSVVDRLASMWDNAIDAATDDGTEEMI